LKLLVALALTGCAGASVRKCVDTAPREGWLIGEGEASLNAPDAAEMARKRALSALAEQIDVAIASSFHAQESETRANQAVAQQSRFETHLDTRSAIDLQGAEVVQRCAEETTLRTRVGIDRARFAADAQRRLAVASAEIDALLTKAQSAPALDAASALSAALPISAAADQLAFVASVVSRRAVSATHSTSQLRLRLREAIARVGIRVEVDSPSQIALLSRAAQSCLGSLGLPAVTSSGDALLSLAVVVQPPSRVAVGLYVARATLSAVLRRSGATVGGAEAQVKGGGATAEAAADEAVRRLAVDELPGLLDRAVAALGWTGLGRCAGP
jgi:hypothetical protein